jgi:hypothetical protein
VAGVGGGKGGEKEKGGEGEGKGKKGKGLDMAKLLSDMGYEAPKEMSDESRARDALQR